MPAPNEQELINGCRNKDRYWQEQLHRTYYGRLMRICARYARNMEDAEQLLQDGFLRIFSKIDSYEHKGSFEGWMKQIIVNICLDFLKTKTGKAMADLEIDHHLTDTLPGTIVQNGLEQLAFKDLLRIIQQLPDMNRTVFNLFVFEGYSHKEIASLLGTTESSSSWHVYQARKLLQESILTHQVNDQQDAGK